MEMLGTVATGVKVAEGIRDGVAVGDGVGEERIGEKGVGEMGTKLGKFGSSVWKIGVAWLLFEVEGRVQAINIKGKRKTVQPL